jgi:hypothetical protein
MIIVELALATSVKDKTIQIIGFVILLCPVTYWVIRFITGLWKGTRVEKGNNTIPARFLRFIVFCSLIAGALWLINLITHTDANDRFEKEFPRDSIQSISTLTLSDSISGGFACNDQLLAIYKWDFNNEIRVEAGVMEELAKKQRAHSKSGVKTTVWVEHADLVVGHYTGNGGEAIKPNRKVYVIDLKSKAIIAIKQFEGGDPPEQIRKGKNTGGKEPNEKIADWLGEIRGWKK